jgi:hypothetical protein
MPKNIFIFLILLSIISCLNFSFASTRSDVMDNALSQNKLAQNLKDSSFTESKEQYESGRVPEVQGQSLTDDKRFYISAGYNANHMHYKETSGSNTLDEDYGKLKGFYILGGYRSDNYTEWLLGKFFIEGYFRRYDEEILYDGASALGPIEFKQRWEAQRFGVKLGARRDIWDRGEFFGYFDIGHNIWYRGENEVINGVLTYAEKYWWTFFGLGTGINYEIFPKLTAGLEGEFMFAPAGNLTKMRADLYEGGTFKLGDVWGIELKIPIKYRVFKNLSLDLTPYFTYWKIKESGTIQISGTNYVEPDSRTHIEGVMAGLTYYF